MAKIAIIGSAGQLGSAICYVLSQDDNVELYPLDRTSVDCTNLSSVESALYSFNPDVVINTAAYVRVDDAEQYPDLALSVNAKGAENVALACARIEAVPVYISTDYVFDGAKGSPYIEEDIPNPLNVYGRSKLLGEIVVRETCHNHFIVRTSGLYGKRQTGDQNNFIETMLKLEKANKSIRVVNDQVFSPTSSMDLAFTVADLITTEQYGTYHATNSGECSWYEFGKAIFEISGLNPDYGPISSADYSAKAQRPPYSVLDNSLLKSLGITKLIHWKEALGEFLSNR